PFLPSWAPDWNTYWAATPLSSLIATTANASGDLPAVASFSDDGMTLTVQGLRLPPIQIVQEGLDASKSDSYTFREVTGILPAARLYAQACLGMSPTSTDPQMKGSILSTGCCCSVIPRCRDCPIGARDGRRGRPNCCRGSRSRPSKSTPRHGCICRRSRTI